MTSTTLTVSPNIHNDIAEAVVRMAHPGFHGMTAAFAVASPETLVLDQVYVVEKQRQWNPWPDNAIAIDVQSLVDPNNDYTVVSEDSEPGDDDQDMAIYFAASNILTEITIDEQGNLVDKPAPATTLTQEQMHMAFGAQKVIDDAKTQDWTPEQTLSSLYDFGDPQYQVERARLAAGTKLLETWKFAMSYRSTFYPTVLKDNQIIVDSGYIATSPAWRIVTFSRR